MRLHVGSLIGQIAMILADGMARGEFVAGDPGSVARAVLLATSSFHHPAMAASWKEPHIDEAVDDVWGLVLCGLVRR